MFDLTGDFLGAKCLRLKLGDQFLQDSSNKREDSYGGSIENRARLMLEVTETVLTVWEAGRVGMHLAPRGDSHSMGDSDPLATFSYVAQQLADRKIAFICTREYLADDSITPEIKKIFGGVVIANEKFEKANATAALNSGTADAVAFGKLFIANPDLPNRFLKDLPLNQPNPETFYASGATGYTDYPRYDDATEQTSVSLV